MTLDPFGLWRAMDQRLRASYVQHVVWRHTLVGVFFGAVVGMDLGFVVSQSIGLLPMPTPATYLIQILAISVATSGLGWQWGFRSGFRLGIDVVRRLWHADTSNIWTDRR